MAIRIYDPTVLKAQGALVDFMTMLRQRAGAAGTTHDIKLRRLLLRWQTNPGVGLPTEPFKVWRRPALPVGQLHPVGFEVLPIPFYTVIQFDTPLAAVGMRLESAAGGTMMAAVLAGPPVLEGVISLQTWTVAAGGSREVQLHAPLITGLMFFNVSSFDDPLGLTLEESEKADGWELVETVGLPVDEGDWSSLGQSHGVKQGLVSNPLPAVDAAADRYKRGINPFGWAPTLPDATPAPVWKLPDPLGMVKEAELELLPMLKSAAAMPPDEQAGKLFNFAIDPPQNPAGDTMPASNPGTAQLSPVGLLGMAVATDPLQSVVLGYGTGYDDEDIPQLNFGKFSMFGDSTRSDWDWMITGLWEKGLDGQSNAVEYAAFVPRPALGIPAPPPADFQVQVQANLRPPVADMDWFASIRASWERFPQTELASVASFAAARKVQGSGAPADALLAEHAIAGGHNPIGNARNAKDPEPTRQSATDGSLTVPNDPGSVPMVYAAATQNIFGLWSPWVARPIMVGQPDLTPVQFLAADLRATDPGSGTLCPATLTFEISIDWRVRRPQRVEISGQLFASASRHQAPPSLAPAPGVQKALGGPLVPLSITFAGDVPSVAGGTVEALNSDGTTVVTPGEAGQGTTRRYKVSVPGFSLNYAATQHVGINLRARPVERIAPGRLGPWAPVDAYPRVAYASDPRAVPTAVDIVQLASLPDAAGQCHVHLSWGGIAGAIGYAVYESTETRLHTSHSGLTPPGPTRTLSQRLTTLKQAFATDPIRRDFTRVNAELIPATSLDVAMPRGSQDIHLYVVLPVMAGGKEGPWPSGPDADDSLIAYVAPRVAVPAPPTIEVQMVSDKPPAAPDYRARVRVGTRPSAGAPAKRIDLHRVRVDDAARALDSMGPPVASITASGGGWTVAGSGLIETVTGDDRPTGSWRQVWYRAVAWSEDDPQRGLLKGRSLASPAVSVLVPPAGPPDLSALVMSWPGGDPAVVLVTFTSSAPINPTPVGPHMLTVQASVSGGAALVSSNQPLAQVATVAPVTGSGISRVDGNPQQYRLLLRRASVNDAVSVIVRMTDPLGRVTERTLAIAAGSAVPLPDLSPISGAVVSASVKAYTFSTDAPDSNSAGAFRIRIVLTPASSGGIGGFRVPRSITRGRAVVRGPVLDDPVLTGPVLVDPRGGPILTGGGTRPRSQFALVDGKYVFDAPLSSVPHLAGPPPQSADGLAVMRQRPPMEEHFTIVSTHKLASVQVTITTPDGRTVTRKSRG
jgi:hypothetical protein